MPPDAKDMGRVWDIVAAAPAAVGFTQMFRFSRRDAS